MDAYVRWWSLVVQVAGIPICMQSLIAWVPKQVYHSSSLSLIPLTFSVLLQQCYASLSSCYSSRIRYQISMLSFRGLCSNYILAQCLLWPVPAEYWRLGCTRTHLISTIQRKLVLAAQSVSNAHFFLSSLIYPFVAAVQPTSSTVVSGWLTSTIRTCGRPRCAHFSRIFPTMISKRKWS